MVEQVGDPANELRPALLRLQGARPSFDIMVQEGYKVDWTHHQERCFRTNLLL